MGKKGDKKQHRPKGSQYHSKDIFLRDERTIIAENADLHRSIPSDLPDVSSSDHEFTELSLVDATAENVQVLKESGDCRLPKSNMQLLESRVFMWEFGQNDPKRDSGSRLVRLGYASKLRLGQNYSGIVLSSEARLYASRADEALVRAHGVAGINCSWNRLEEIPFSMLGKSKNQRKLPLLIAANTVNYGKPFKMNTAEATAALLYICGFKEDAQLLLSSFSYGPEFIRLNYEALNAYSECRDSTEVGELTDLFIEAAEDGKREKERVKAAEAQRHVQQGRMGGYMDHMDLPPMGSDDDEDNADGINEAAEGEMEIRPEGENATKDEGAGVEEDRVDCISERDAENEAEKEAEKIIDPPSFFLVLEESSDISD